MEEKRGPLIDSFDHIIRFNRYKIEGFEEYTGSRTDIWSTFGRGELPSDESQRPSKVIFVHGDRGNPAYKVDSIWRIPLSFYNSLRSDIFERTESPNRDNIIPSSGLLVIKWLADNIPNTLYITGFDNFRKEKSGKHHYWVKNNFSKPKEHDGEVERELIYEMIDNGSVIEF